MNADPMDLIMDSVAETRDRLNRLGHKGHGEAGPSSRTISRRCHHGKLSRNCELCDRERKIESLDRLCRRQSSILTGVALAVRGEPEDTFVWSHHDLVEWTQAAMDELEALRVEREAQAERVAAAQSVLDELEALRGEREAQARRIADLEAQHLAADVDVERAAHMSTIRQKKTRLIAAHLPRSQSELLVLAAQLGRFKARDRSPGRMQSGVLSLEDGHQDTEP